MGKGRVIEHLGQGQYRIEIVEDRARAESRLARSQQRLGEIDAEIVEEEQALAESLSAINAAIEEQNQAIEKWRQEMEAEGESDVALAKTAETVLQAFAVRDGHRLKIAQLKEERLARVSIIERIEALPEPREITAWCGDYTDDLSGDVATAEVPGEAKQILIRPGYSGNQTDEWPEPLRAGATWSAERDGALQPALAGTPAGVFYHLAMMPGWQRWRPTFRIGTITEIEADLCDITLDPATSRHQGLNVNPQSNYSGVPIYYMDCNGVAFSEGDRVLVAFSGNTEKPMVIGFESQPRTCGVTVVVMDGEYSSIYDENTGAWKAEDFDHDTALVRDAYGDRIESGAITCFMQEYRDRGTTLDPGSNPVPDFFQKNGGYNYPPSRTALFNYLDGIEPAGTMIVIGTNNLEEYFDNLVPLLDEYAKDRGVAVRFYWRDAFWLQHVRRALDHLSGNDIWDEFLEWHIPDVILPEPEDEP